MGRLNAWTEMYEEIAELIDCIHDGDTVTAYNYGVDNALNIISKYTNRILVDGVLQERATEDRIYRRCSNCLADLTWITHDYIGKYCPNCGCSFINVIPSGRSWTIDRKNDGNE